MQGLAAGTLYDGSGLSRADRLSALQLARIVDRGIDAGTQTKLWPLKSGLPTAGRTGTLASRFSTTASKCAVGKVWAKTGTLGDVVALAGWTTGADGRVEDLRLPRQRQDLLDDVEAERRHAGRHGQRLLLSERALAP